MEFERNSLMQELAGDLPLRIVVSRLQAAAISPVVQRRFVCREE
jgi:hypothetical protein